MHGGSVDRAVGQGASASGSLRPKGANKSVKGVAQGDNIMNVSILQRSVGRTDTQQFKRA